MGDLAAKQAGRARFIQVLVPEGWPRYARTGHGGAAQFETATGAGLPKFVKDEFDAFLECGILAHGFLRLRCADCAHDKLIAFSFKRRELCPSCGARRISETATYLVDHVIPEVPVRQWVLSLRILVEDQGERYLADDEENSDEARTLRPLQRGSCVYRIAFGPRAGQRVQTLQGALPREASGKQRLCADLQGFSLQAAVRCTTHQVMSPLEFMQRLAALVPRPRLRLILFHGVLSPNAKLRAKLLKRVFNLDLEHCPNCGGELKIIAAILERASIEKILTHLGLQARAPPRAPARGQMPLQDF
jgi:hypothetical protein